MKSQSLGINNLSGKWALTQQILVSITQVKKAASTFELLYLKNLPLLEDQILQPILFMVANTVNSWRIKTPDYKDLLMGHNNIIVTLLYRPETI